MSQYTHSQIKAVLLRARTLLADPNNWTRYAQRRGKSGIHPARDSEDFAYCLIGAINQATNVFGNNPLIERSDALSREAQLSLRSVIGRNIDRFNDDRTTTHAMVVTKLDSAIQREERLAKQDGSAR